jgi:hypothetical protein
MGDFPGNVRIIVRWRTTEKEVSGPHENSRIAD